MKPGTYVTRSVYQKAIEENRRLMRDIKILCTAPVTESFKLRVEWRRKFQHEDELNAMIRKFALDYGKEHPELRIKAKGYNFCDRCGGAFKSTDPEMKLCPCCYT